MAGKGWKEVVRGLKTGQLRWCILIMLFLATVINYLDRQTLSFLAPTIQKELGFGEQAYSNVVLAFTLATVATLFFAGPIVDRVGTRISFMVAIGFWSLATGLHAAAAGALGLAIFRIMLGIGEAGNWPCASKAVSEWFPAHERGFAMGFFNGGVSIGAIIAAPLVAALAVAFGSWRPVFIVTALTGVVWMFIWLPLYYHPRSHPHVSPEELEFIEEGKAPKSVKAPFWTVAKKSEFWGIFIARSLTSPVWFFVSYWIAKYLNTAFHFDLTQIGMYAWIPFLTADLGNILGGLLSGWMIVKGSHPITSRVVIMGVGSVGMVASFLVTQASTPVGAIALIGILTFSFGLWVSNMLALVSDSFPANEVATVISWTGVGQQGGGSVFIAYIGWVLARGGAAPSYFPVFTVAAVLPIISFVFTLWLNRAPAESRPPIP